jgi:hypothetical protein
LLGHFQQLHSERMQKTEAAAVAQREFETAWKNADTKLKIVDL